MKFNAEWDLDSLEFHKTGLLKGVVVYKKKGLYNFQEEEVSVTFREWLSGKSVRDKALKRINELRLKFELENRNIRLQKLESTISKQVSTSTRPTPTTSTSQAYTNKSTDKRRTDDDDYTVSLSNPLNPLSPFNSSLDTSCDDDNNKSTHSNSSSHSSSSSHNSNHSNHSNHSSHHSSSYDSGHSSSSYDSGSSYSSSDSSSTSSSDW
jgi:hypothetical protein